MRADDIKALRAELNGLTKNFERLVTEQRTLGFSDIEGLRGVARCRQKIERAINENVAGWPADAKLMMALLLMRQHDAEYRQSG
jgi:hypothetical protein